MKIIMRSLGAGVLLSLAAFAYKAGYDSSRNDMDSRPYRVTISFNDRPTEKEVKERLKPLLKHCEDYSIKSSIENNVTIDLKTKIHSFDIYDIATKINKIDPEKTKVGFQD